MWGIIPAAGEGSRIQPLAFSKELLPVGSRFDGATERPRAVSEYVLDRMLLSGADRICFVISPGKSDILEYYGSRIESAGIFYAVQPSAAGLCDAIFRAVPLIPRYEPVCVGLPDTVWFPENGLCKLPEDRLSFLLFPVKHPERFDAVVTGKDGQVLEIQVKTHAPNSRWIWGAFKMPGSVLHDLHSLWRARDCQDQYIGTLVNAWIGQGGRALGVRAGTAYVDVGTLNGYREAVQLLNSKSEIAAAASPRLIAMPATLAGTRPRKDSRA